MAHPPAGNGQPRPPAQAVEEVRWIEIDLADLGLAADLATPEALAAAAAHLYERFVPYADEGWEWVTYPGSRAFDGWQWSEQAPGGRLLGARLLSRRLAPEEPAGSQRPAHGLSPYRTWQLTTRPWTADPGSKRWQPLR